MKVTGIIAEYNPFHNGHAYQLKKAREMTGADYLVVVLSGDFTQRGIPAVIDKYARTRMALEAGADLVIELPLYYAAGSAEYFASGACAILDKIGVVDTLVFGSECGDIQILTDIANILIDEKDNISSIIKNKVRNGMSYPLARVNAIEELIPNSYMHVNAMQAPNNILGFEYIRALKQRNSKIVPITNQRVGSGYHDRMMTSPTTSSALAIRNSLEEAADITLLKSQVPSKIYSILEEEWEKTFPVFNEDLSSMLKYKLLLDSASGYTDYVDISEDFSDKIIKNLNKYVSYSQFCDLLKTKDITYARVARNLLHILLNIKKDSLKNYIDNDYIVYARMLGFREDAKELLGAIKKNSEIPLISKLADARNVLDSVGMDMLESDIQAAHIYDTIVTNKFQASTVSEFQREIIKI